MISSTKSSTQSSTLSEFIELKDTDDITYYNYSILEYLNGFDMFISNIIYDYEDEIVAMAKFVDLTNEELFKYRYKPYLLAYDVYGSPEAQFIIMMLNNIIDPKDFNINKIKLISKSDLNNILGKIYSANQEFLENNRIAINNSHKENETNAVWEA